MRAPKIGRRLLVSADKASRETAGSARATRHPLAQPSSSSFSPPYASAYTSMPQPGVPDAPLAARLANPGNDVALLLAKAENHLIQNPDDTAPAGISSRRSICVTAGR